MFFRPREEAYIMKRWRKTEKCHAPILDKFQRVKFPGTFYAAFSTVFGGIKDEKEAIGFLKTINRKMEKRKGDGTIFMDEIIKMRRGGYFDVTEVCNYTEHHVTPRSRDSREDYFKSDQIVLLPERFHAGWHMLFLNLYAEETVYFLKFLFLVSNCKNEKKEINYRRLNNIVEGLIKEDEKILSRV